MPPSLPEHLKGIRRAVASILRSNQHLDRLYGTDEIAHALRVSARVGSSLGDDASPTNDINSRLVLRAFSFDGREEYDLPYGGVFGYCGNRCVLHYQ